MNAVVDKNKLHNDAQSLERGMLRFITAGSVDYSSIAKVSLLINSMQSHAHVISAPSVIWLIYRY